MKFYDTSTNHVYTSLWHKYRPAILQLMIASSQEPQKYKLFPHEFKALNPKEKGGYTFTLQAYRGKPMNNIKTSSIAQDLLYVLEVSKKASELMGADAYAFQLDKQFVLHITKIEAPVPAEVVAG
jgi:hypothetical protein